MKIVIDSNVYISAFATRGLCSEVFELCLAEHNIYICNEIISEIERILINKIKVPDKIDKETVEYLNQHIHKVKPVKVSKEVCRDRKDLMVLGTAEEVGADIIITGDNDLLVLEKYKNTKIVNPSGFWKLSSKILKD